LRLGGPVEEDNADGLNWASNSGGSGGRQVTTIGASVAALGSTGRGRLAGRWRQRRKRIQVLGPLMDSRWVRMNGDGIVVATVQHINGGFKFSPSCVNGQGIGDGMMTAWGFGGKGGNLKNRSRDYRSPSMAT
jgi:hypothetical protein